MTEELDVLNIGGELILVDIYGDEVHSVEFEINEFDDRNEEFFDPIFGYELGDVYIDNKELEFFNFSTELKKEIIVNCEYIVQAVNNQKL